MSSAELKAVNIDSLPIRQRMGNIEVQVVNLGGSKATLVTVNPGGSWSKDLKAAHGTDSCQSNHLGFVISGNMAIRMDDGHELRMGPRDVFFVPKGHDAWCDGKEPAVFLEFARDGL